jgi:hypothetical protein
MGGVLALLAMQGCMLQHHQFMAEALGDINNVLETAIELLVLPTLLNERIPIPTTKPW